ncbi:hypothetical protein CHS0354_028739 [Potamilus streckersoni]|uniref:lysozyme n=1 Tax=Potamilus streckersoni TaxID=2493646 RepID=A0AAE0VSG2_9BIVA|nr:hypothetical protein CHS0354_028739 [Potamilus streckersoni]
MLSLLFVFLGFFGFSEAAPAAGTCMCVHASGVHVRSGAGLNHGIVATANTGDCFKFNGGVHTQDGHTWYELQNVHGQHLAWIASEFLQESTASHCTSTGVSGGGTGTFATGIVSQHCLQCICNQESGCKPLGCHWDVNSNSCGYFQIKNVYWIDCGKLGPSWEACASDLHCSSQCVQKVMARYIGPSGCPHNCESFARIHNGGPAGCHHTNTVGYWHGIQSRGCNANS